MVPTFLIGLSFVMMMALGATIVTKAVRHPPHRGSAKLSIFGTQFSLSGPAWLVMIVIGGLLTATPVIAAVVQPRASEPFKPPAAVVVADSIDDADYGSFEFLSDSIVLDLRHTQSLTWLDSLRDRFGWISRHSRVRPATVINQMTVRKVAAQDQIRIGYTASGELDLRCLSQPFSVRLATDRTRDVRQGELVINVKDVPVGSVFVIVNEVTYWNSFRGTDQDDYSTYTHNHQSQPEDLSVAIIFPEHKRFKTMDVSQRGRDDEALLPLGGDHQRTPGPENSTFYWSATTPAGERRYVVLAWTW